MTEQNKTPLTAQPGSVPAPEHKPAEKPLRRVGSLTLGACLIAAGVFFLLYFFVPGFDVQLTLKIAPAVALVLSRKGKANWQNSRTECCSPVAITKSSGFSF